MNRAASYLWATTVALVLFVGPAHATTNVIKFSKPVKHDVHSVQPDWARLENKTSVPDQSLSNKKGSNVVKIKPSAGKNVPKSTFKGALKNALKFNPARAMAAGAIAGAVGAVGWLIDTGSQSPTKDQLVKPVPGQPADFTIYHWLGTGSGLSNFSVKASSPTEALNKVANAYNTGPWVNATVISQTKINSKSYEGTVRRHYNNNPSNFQEWTVYASAVGSCPVGYSVKPTGECTSDAANYSTLTDSDLDNFVNVLDSMSETQFRAIYDDLVSINPELGMYLPDYLTAPDGSFQQHMVSPLQTTTIGRVTNGVVERLTLKEWSEYSINYSPTSPSFNYTVTNKSETYNEAGEKVSEETTTETSEEVAPELSQALDAANDPLNDWAAGLADPSSATAAGISYPLLFTYGGTCSLAPVSLPYFGTYGLDPICKAINDYVKPILGILFSAWTILHIFGVWRETTIHVRPA